MPSKANKAFVIEKMVVNRKRFESENRIGEGNTRIIKKRSMRISSSHFLLLLVIEKEKMVSKITMIRNK